jgi:hypothetical protein
MYVYNIPPGLILSFSAGKKGKIIQGGDGTADVNSLPRKFFSLSFMFLCVLSPPSLILPCLPAERGTIIQGGGMVCRCHPFPFF